MNAQPLLLTLITTTLVTTFIPYLNSISNISVEYQFPKFLITINNKDSILGRGEDLIKPWLGKRGESTCTYYREIRAMTAVIHLSRQEQIP